eukprot:scaffold90639_cov66-Phaeocystis_antarctica.AAC.8
MPTARLVHEHGGEEDAGHSQPHVEEVVDPARHARDEEGLEVGERSPLVVLARKADRRDEEKVVEVVGRSEPEAADHVVDVHGVDYRQRPLRPRAKRRGVRVVGGIEGVERVGEHGTHRVEGHGTDKQVGEGVDEEPPGQADVSA